MTGLINKKNGMPAYASMTVFLLKYGSSFIEYALSFQRHARVGGHPIAFRLCVFPSLHLAGQ
jgi:hypothetical protein